MKEFNVTLKISSTGKTAQIVHANGRLIAEMLVHGPLLETTDNCADKRPILKGRPNVFRAEMFGLAGYEFLNMEAEKIEEK